MSHADKKIGPCVLGELLASGQSEREIAPIVEYIVVHLKLLPEQQTELQSRVNDFWQRHTLDTPPRVGSAEEIHAFRCALSRCSVEQMNAAERDFFRTLLECSRLPDRDRQRRIAKLDRCEAKIARQRQRQRVV